MAKPNCPECGSNDTKKAKQVVAEGTSSSSGVGVGLGAGGLGVGLGTGRTKSRLAEGAKQEDGGGCLPSLIAFIGYALVLGLSVVVWNLVNDRLEWIAATISAIVFFGLGAWIMNYIAAVLTMLIMLGLAVWLSVYVADNYSWWVGAPVGLFALIIAYFMAVDSIKSFFAEMSGANDEEYRKTWMCMSCGSRFIAE